MPVLVGSLGRVPVGALTDRFGGRLMFTSLTLASAVPVLLVAFAGSLKSYALLLVFGFFLGLAGTTFAVGIPFVNAWFEPARRGFASGVFGAGMGGTALSSFFTPRLVRSIGYIPTHLLIAAALVVVGAVLWLLMRDSPAWKPNLAPVVPKLAAAAAHLADVIPLRRHLWWFRSLLHLPADISEECLRLWPDRRRH
jgi:MFS transporter, NNP family, nitrate/nitrite transporter